MIVRPDLPENESREHFLLKQVGLIWLKHYIGCQYVSTEISGMTGILDTDKMTIRRRNPPLYRSYGSFEGTINSWSREVIKERTIERVHKRTVADVVGVHKRKVGYDWAAQITRHEYVVRLIEVKVSREDFKTGYCTGAHYAYLLTPAGLVSPKELPNPVGLLEVDITKLQPYRYVEKVVGLVNVKKRPKRQEIDIDSQHLIEYIAAKATNQFCYKNPWLLTKDQD